MDEEQAQQEISDEEAILKIAAAMKDNAPTPDDKQSIHTFLFNVVTAEDTKKIGNLRDDKDMNELGFPSISVRGGLDISRFCKKIRNDDFFSGAFADEVEDTLATSLSREGFLVRQATTQTKQVADVTRRKKINKGWFKSTTEVQGGDTTGGATQP